ncbi:uncharacterized protein LOC144115756 isoform X1 [Amblyomma americanum]
MSGIHRDRRQRAGSPKREPKPSGRPRPSSQCMASVGFETTGSTLAGNRVDCCCVPSAFISTARRSPTRAYIRSVWRRSAPRQLPRRSLAIWWAAAASHQHSFPPQGDLLRAHIFGVSGVGRLRNNWLDARWQSSGLQLPLISIQFHCKVTIQGICICADYMRGESCNPNRRFGSVHRHSQPQATAVRRDVAPEPTPPVHFCHPALQSPASPPPSPQGQENSEVTCADDTTPKAAGRADTDHGCFEVLTSRPPVGLQPSDITGAVTPLCSLIQQHQAAFVAHTSEARKLVDECAAANVSTLSLLQSTVQGLQEQQTAQMATGLMGPGHTRLAVTTGRCSPLQMHRQAPAEVWDSATTSPQFPSPPHLLTRARVSPVVRLAPRHCLRTVTDCSEETTCSTIHGTTALREELFADPVLHVYGA